MLVGVLVQINIAHADSVANCINKMTQVNSWQPFSAEAHVCIKSRPQLKDILKGLCIPSGNDISIEYKKYLNFKHQFDQQLKIYENAKDQTTKTGAEQRIQSIQQDWEVLGFKNEIYMLESSITICRQ